MIKVVSLFLSVTSVAFGQLKLGGKQYGVFDSSTYIVMDDLIVPEGKSLDFLPNASLLVLPKVGIRVEGQLKLKDAKLSCQDSTEYWNGIEVGQGGKIHLDNVTIQRSVFGISVHDSSSIQNFDNVTFKGNKSTLRIANDPVFIREGIPYTLSKVVKNANEEVKKDFASDKLLQADDKNERMFRASKWISAITTFTGIVGCIVSIEESTRYYSKYEKETSGKAKRYKDKSIFYKNAAIFAGVGAGISGASLSVSFALDSKKKDNNK